MPYRFKEVRLQAGFTTVQLAQKMGVTQAAVSHWDAGKKVPGTETLCKLADLYGVTIDYLLGRSSDTGITYTPAEIVDASTLPALHGKPVWASGFGWGIVNSIQKHVVFMEGITVPFDELQGLSVLPLPQMKGYCKRKDLMKTEYMH